MKIYDEKSNSFIETVNFPIEENKKHGEVCKHKKRVKNYIEILVRSNSETGTVYISHFISKEDLLHLAERIKEIENEEPFDEVCDNLPF